MIKETAQKAKSASIILSSLNTDLKNYALNSIAQNLEINKEKIFEANRKDLEEAETMVSNGELSKSVYNRLKLDENKFLAMVQGVKDIVKLDDPVNKTLLATRLDDGLDLYKISCPIGVIGVIFEARPDVIVQISSLAIKSANSVILKGGKEAKNTNETLYNIISSALNNVENFPENTISLIHTREEVAQMLNLDKYIDLIIPRGGNKLVKFIKENTKIPVLGHADGICHIFIDESADINKAIKISIDAKTQYPSACNSVETILLHNNLTDKFVKEFIKNLQNADIQIKGDERIQKASSDITPATEEDWGTEYGEKIVSVKFVNNLNAAIDHINNYGSGHTESIITENKENAEIFMNLVDSAGVYHNASTRFADGFRYGFGAEVGISTNKTHARGPVGLEGLTIYKYKLYGNGQIVDDYAQNKSQFKHEKLI